MTTFRLTSTTMAIAIVNTVLTGQLSAQPSAREFVPFKTFVEHTKEASTAPMLRPGSRVKEPEALAEMRQHILKLYSGVDITHSFVQGTDHFDCIPVDQQPAVRAHGLITIEAPPPLTGLAAPVSPVADALTQRPRRASQRPEVLVDEFGNSTSCQANTFPMRRVTLEEMTQFPTLGDFLAKKPGAAPHALNNTDELAKPATGNAGHKYSIVYQNVDNLGGNSNLNLWSPYVNTSLGEVFSLSQQWYVGGSGASLQTAEVGWQNYPAKYGNQNSRLFIYWTADGYNRTGCYNLDCGAFVQVSSGAYLGGEFSSYSTFGGTQWEVAVQFYLFQGNWWLNIDGNWIGYYPGAIYGGGQLSANAQTIEFGTESAGTAVWPGEGSGDWSTSGWSYAAYQRNLFYIDTNNSDIWASLNASQPSPSCYSITGPFVNNGGDAWTVFFFQGGPGGYGC